MTIQPIIVNPNRQLGNLTDDINWAINQANDCQLLCSQLVKNIAVVFTDGLYDTIPELGFSAWTHSDDLIIFNVDSQFSINRTDLFLHICHELAHAIRWQHNNEWSDTLLKTMLFEGVAVAVSQQIADANHIEPDAFLRVIINTTDDDCQQILTSLQPLLNSSNYSHDQIFVTGSDTLPHWAGYIAGYHLVKQYLELTDQLATDVIDAKYRTIIDKLSTTNSRIYKK